MTDNPSIAGSAPLNAPTPQPAQGSQPRTAFQPISNAAGAHLHSQAPAGAPPVAPTESLNAPHLTPSYPASQPTSSKDPLARSLDLPSGGLDYADGTKEVVIRPMRGMEEMNIAGTSKNSPERSRTTREVIQKCTTIRGGISFEELTVMDYAHIVTNIMAATNGTDELNLDASGGCGKANCPLASQPVTLLSMPCVYLRRGGDQKDEEEVDPIIAAAMRIEAKEKGDNPDEWGFGRKYRNVSETYTHNQQFSATIGNGIRVTWRRLRVKDQIAAEEFLQETGVSTDVEAKAALACYLMGRAIQSINGQSAATVIAMQWYREAPSPILRELRAAMARHQYGYDHRPQFRCPRSACRKEVQASLPKDGSLFRSNR